MRPDILTACDYILAAMINGVWQGIIITTLVALGLRVTRRTNAATRHAIWFTTLMMLAALIPAHALRDHLSHRGNVSITAKKAVSGIGVDGARSWPALPSAIQSDQALQGTGRELPAGEVEPALRPEDLDEAGRLAIASEYVAHPESSSELAGSVSLGLPELDNQNQSAPISAALTWLQRTVNRLLHPISWNVSASAGLPRATIPVLLSICLSVATIRLALLFRSGLQMRRLKRTSVAPDGALAERFSALCRNLDVKRSVELRISSLHRSPVLVGFVHPVILLPCQEDGASRLTDSEQILSHELAHVRRWDDWANLVQHLVQAAFFFHPAVWWLSKRLVFERELACDDWVLQQGTRPRAYALLLADLASRISRRPLLLAPGVSTTKSELLQRINMILNTRRNASTRLASTRLGVITAAAALTAALGLYFAPRLVLAQEQPADTAPDARQVAESDDKIPALAAPSLDADWEETDVADLPPPAPPARPPAIIARQDFKPVPPRPSVNEVPDVGGAPQPDQPGAFPRQPRRPGSRSRDASLEERLARLEEMVHSLLAQQGARFVPGEPPAEWRESEDRARMREQELFERQNARAAEEAARVKQEREREFHSEPGQRRQDKLHADLARRMKSLQEQRETLERQMQELRRDIEKIEREQQGVKQRNEQDSLLKKRKSEPQPGE